MSLSSFEPLPTEGPDSPRSKDDHDEIEEKSVSSVVARAIAREKLRRRVMSLVAIAAYVMSGLTIVIVNKGIVRDSGLHAPALVSSMGALFTAMTMRFLVFMGKVQVSEVDLTPLEFAVWRAFPVGVLAAGSLVFGNMSYIYLDAGFVQMLKAGTPALLLLVLSAFKIEKITPLGGSLALTMVCGSVLACLQQPNINTMGLFIQAASQACEVLQCTAVQFFLQKLGFNAFDAGFYLAPAVAMCCLVTSMIVEWPSIVRNEQVWLLCTQLPLLFASGVIGIVVNLSSLLVIKYTSSLLAKLLVIVRSSVLVLFFIIFGEEFTFLQVIGYMVTIVAFTFYSALKATEVNKEQEEELRRLSTMEEGGEEDAPPVELPSEKFRKMDLTSAFFWFATLILLGSGYQAFILGVIEEQGGLFGHPFALASQQVPPAPFVNTQQGLAPVQTSLKVLYTDEDHFLLHMEHEDEATVQGRTERLSSAWLVTSSQFGNVQLRAMGEQSRWLDCNFHLAYNIHEACDFWMTPLTFDAWGHESFILRHAGGVDGTNSVAVKNGGLAWSTEATAFRVSDWVPEACSLKPQAATESYAKAAKEVTLTMSTHLEKYADSIKFREVLSSVLMHLKEADVYVKEFLVIDDWFDGGSLALNGTRLGPKVEELRRENVAFFPGCVGMNASLASERPTSQRCTFLWKSKDQEGEAHSVNMLLNLMTTEFWLHIDMETVFHQDFYLSRLLEPLYDQKERCEEAMAEAETTSTTSLLTTSLLPEVWDQDGGAGDGGDAWDARDAGDEGEYRVGDGDGDGYRGEKVLYYKGEYFHVPYRGDEWSASASRRLSACQAVAGVRLNRGNEKTYTVQRYHAPAALHNDTYVSELLNVSESLDKDSDEWDAFQKAVQWPLFSLRTSLFNVTYIKTLEAPGEAHFPVKQDFRQSELEFAVRWARAGAAYASLSGLC